MKKNICWSSRFDKQHHAPFFQKKLARQEQYWSKENKERLNSRLSTSSKSAIDDDKCAIAAEIIFTWEFSCDFKVISRHSMKNYFRSSRKSNKFHYFWLWVCCPLRDTIFNSMQLRFCFFGESILLFDWRNTYLLWIGYGIWIIEIWKWTTIILSQEKEV